MAIRTLSVKTFNGGISPNEKTGPANSFKRLQHIDIHRDVSYATLFPALSKVSGTTVTGKVKWIVDGSPFDTNRYFYDHDGDLYRETSAGTWSLLRADATIGNGCAGQGLEVFDDYLYYTTSTTIGRYGPLSGTPAFDDDFLSDGTTNVDQSDDGTGEADYVPPTSIAETAAARQTFTPTADTLKAIIIDVDVVGTGNWTLTVHDSDNVLVGSSTIANGSMATGEVTFTFSTPLRVIIGNEYHFHVTSTVADGGVDTGDATDLERAYFESIYGILVADTNWHPALFFKNQLIIGNERYVATWDLALYTPNKLTLGAGFTVRTITMVDEFVVIGCSRGDSIGDTEEGRIYFWDGIQPTFNYYKDTPLGMVNALHNSKNRLMSILGQKGAIYFGAEPFQKLQDLQLLSSEATVEVYPGAVTEWQGKTYIGYAGSTSSDDIEDTYLGVYELGSRTSGEQEALTHAQTISTGTEAGTTLEVSAVAAFGNDLYVAWRDDSSYGVDKASIDSDAQTSGAIETLIFDANSPNKQKISHGMKVTFESLPSGCTITPKYKIDRASSWTSLTTEDTDGETVTESHTLGVRFREIEFGVDIVSGGNYPKITGIYLFFDDAAEEDDQ